MIHSMTAYARHVSIDPQQHKWLWEIRSVNHRYLEQSYRLPEAMRSHEQACRQIVADHVSRGKLELSLKPMIGTAQDLHEAPTAITLNQPLLEAIVYTANTISEKYDTAPIDTIDILKWPGILESPELDSTAFEAQQQWLCEALTAALADFANSRASEGTKIAQMLILRCDEIQLLVNAIRPRREHLMTEKQEKLITRITELGVEVDADRIAQEVAIMAQKLDVAEELDRLDAHLVEVRDILARDEAVVGRRLDFMMQELNREANTLGSKSNDTETTQAVVDIKVLLEQMREQIQNIE